MGVLRRLQNQIKNTSMIHHFFRNVRRQAHHGKRPLQKSLQGPLSAY